MNLILPFEVGTLTPSITYHHKMMLIGSCFTEHIGNRLHELKFNVFQNPNGILFDTVSICNALQSYIAPIHYEAQDLFQHQGLYHSWAHHSRYAHTSAKKAIDGINLRMNEAHDFLRTADWLLITLGTSYTYFLNDTAPAAVKKVRSNLHRPAFAEAVANCHKYPAHYFEKRLVSIEDQISIMETTLHQLLHFNPSLKVIFTVSPVRHIRDGVVENNRSKGRLIEMVHYLVDSFQGVFYFSAYELVIDVLRDYRFYDTDLVHPSSAASTFVFEQFEGYAFDKETKQLSEAVKQIVQAFHHAPLHPESEPHRAFMIAMHEKTKALAARYLQLDFKEALAYFSNHH
ncbi:MAG: GSCFA domain-containing protein [Chitinophagaceae bacterium]